MLLIKNLVRKNRMDLMLLQASSPWLPVVHLVRCTPVFLDLLVNIAKIILNINFESFILRNLRYCIFAAARVETDNAQVFPKKDITKRVRVFTPRRKILASREPYLVA